MAAMHSCGPAATRVGPGPLVPVQVCLCGSGVAHDRPLEFHLLWDFASTTPGSAMNSMLHFIFVSFAFAFDPAAGSSPGS